MSKFKIKNLFSNASFFFLGAVFCSVLGVGAACLPNLAATNVTYSNDKSKSTDVQAAIDELYTKKDYCPDGYECYDSLRKKIIESSNGIVDDTDGSFFSKTALEQGENSYGVYELKSTVDDTYPVYFFRGDNTVNNNLIFSGYCWKIIRTTELGGVRIIYNGEVGEDGKCYGPNYITLYRLGYDFSFLPRDEYQYVDSFDFNSLSDNQEYIGYKYKTYLDNDTSSNIKTALEAWFYGVSKKQDYIEDSYYCNDRTTMTTEEVNEMNLDSNNTYYRGVYRAFKGTPSVKCSRELDKNTVSDNYGNGDSLYPIGFVTIDEIMLAGNTWDNNMNSYIDIQDNGSLYWTGTPYSSSKETATNFVVSDYTAINNSELVDDPIRIRPVISLKKNIGYRIGDGSIDNPFIIE